MRAVLSRPTYPFGRDCRFAFHSSSSVDSEEEEEDLHNSLPPVTSTEHLARQRNSDRALWRKRADRLGRFLETRPGHSDLIVKNIIPSTSSEARAEMRVEIEAHLERRLSQRPTADELEQKNILHSTPVFAVPRVCVCVFGQYACQILEVVAICPADFFFVETVVRGNRLFPVPSDY